MISLEEKIHDDKCHDVSSLFIERDNDHQVNTVYTQAFNSMDDVIL